MELFGSGYVIDHCITAYSLITEELNYKIYVTDCLKVLIGGENVPRYIDLIKNNNDAEPKETAEQIIDRISRGLDRLGGDKENANTI